MSYDRFVVTSGITDKGFVLANVIDTENFGHKTFIGETAVEFAMQLCAYLNDLLMSGELENTVDCGEFDFHCDEFIAGRGE